MHSVWCKYIYNKIRMKNLPILFTLYWLTMQIYAIVTLLDGIPSAPSPSHIYNIMETDTLSSQQKLESQIASKLDVLHALNDTKGVSSSASETDPQEAEKGPSPQSVARAPDEFTDSFSGSPVDSQPKIEEERGRDAPEDEELKDELIDSVAIEATPLADSDFVTEQPPSQQALPSATDGEAEAEALADLEKKLNETATAEEHPIPVFSEWAKQMEKAEKKQEQDVANASTNKNKPADRQRVSAPKIRAKNYASPDCGAKIIAANQESDNTGHVLSSSKDEYLISICTSRIWFVVELCEPIQAEKVELANFELFSSSPKEFSVSVSNRYPTRDWSDVGQFVAKDERTIQNFELNPKLFGKYVRVDIHSHYNTEHFCPVSLFRVQGTSEFEAFETADQKVPLDDYDDDEEAEKKEAKQQDNNLFKSASDAVISMVKKAAQVLTKGEEKSEGTNETVKRDRNESSCVTWASIISCPSCSESLAGDVMGLLTCRSALLERLWRWNLVQEMVHRTELCVELMGVQLKREIEENGNSRDLRRDFVAKLFPESYLIALCNVAAGQDRRLPRIQGVVQGKTREAAEDQQQKLSETVVNNLTIDGPGLMEMIPKNVDVPFRKDQEDQQQQQGLIFDPREGAWSATEKRNCEKESEPPIDEPKVKEEEKPQEIDSSSPPASAPEPSEVPSQVDRPPPAAAEAQEEEKREVKSEEVVTPPKEIQTQQPLHPTGGDSWRSTSGDNGLAEEGGNMQQKVHGESVFLRLSNRIKALERNMSLSSQYLEELSRRYKKQVEELQQSFAKTILSFEETSKQTVEEKQQLQDENARLRRDIEEVLESFVAWKSILFYLVVFVCIQIVLFVLLLLLYVRNRLKERRREKRREEEEKQLRYVESRQTSVSSAADGKGGRRNSTEGISVSSRSTTSLSEGKKRPSEEALQIVGTYSELLIESPNQTAGAPPPPPQTASSTGSGHKKKNKDKARSRKTSLPNQIYQAAAGAEQKSPAVPKLAHSTSVNGYHGETIPPVDPSEAGSILLEENDEFYLPGSDLYVEFVPEDGDQKKKNKNSRRLSSPAFLRTALSRSISARSSKKQGKSKDSPQEKQQQQPEDDVQSTTSNSSWDWYKLRRSSTKSGRGSQVAVNNGSVSLSSQDSVNPELAVEGVEEEHEEEEEELEMDAEEEVDQEEEEQEAVVASPKKTTKFQRIFRKVF